MTTLTQPAAWPRRPLFADTDRPQSYVFYDIETTGLDPDFDQIVQISAIRTDADFNVVDETKDVINLRCRRLPWVVPSSIALLTTGTEPKALDTEELLPQEAMQIVAEAFDDWSPAIFVGFNSIRFDDEFLRRGFFSSLLSPYLMPGPGSLRADLMRMAQAMHCLRPGAIKVPVRKQDCCSGAGADKPSFRLGDLAQANGVEADAARAHDALEDVRTTIGFAKVMRAAAPDIFDLMLDCASKWHVVEMLEHSSMPNPMTGQLRPLVQTTVIGGLTKVVPLMGLFPSASQPGRIIAADLSIDPKMYLGLDEAELAEFISKDRWRFPALKPNAQPCLVDLSEHAGGTDQALYNALAQHFQTEDTAHPDGVLGLLHIRMQKIIDAWETFRLRLAAALAKLQPTYPEPSEIEQQLYAGGFVSPSDAYLAQGMTEMNPAQMAANAALLQDKRLQAFARRWAFASDPTALSFEQQRQLRSLIETRLLAPPDQPWRSIAKARQELVSLKLEKFGQLGLEELMHLDRIAYWLNDLEARTLKESAAGASIGASDASLGQA